MSGTECMGVNEIESWRVGEVTGKLRLHSALSLPRRTLGQGEETLQGAPYVHTLLPTVVSPPGRNPPGIDDQNGKNP